MAIIVEVAIIVIKVIFTFFMMLYTLQKLANAMTKENSIIDTIELAFGVIMTLTIYKI